MNTNLPPPSPHSLVNGCVVRFAPHNLHAIAVRFAQPGGPGTIRVREDPDDPGSIPIRVAPNDPKAIPISVT